MHAASNLQLRKSEPPAHWHFAHPLMFKRSAAGIAKLRIASYYHPRLVKLTGIDDKLRLPAAPLSSFDCTAEISCQNVALGALKASDESNHHESCIVKISAAERQI